MDCYFEKRSSKFAKHKQTRGRRGNKYTGLYTGVGLMRTIHGDRTQVPEEWCPELGDLAEHCGGDHFGFHHFICHPEGKGYRGCGHSKKDWKKTKDLLERLSKLVSSNPVGPTANMDKLENRRTDTKIGIPAGYTYLLQLAIHDLTRTSVPNPNPSGPRRPVRNLRTAGLELETVFGGGAAACPFAYAQEGVENKIRRRLKVGATRSADQGDEDLIKPERDLPRTVFEPASGSFQTTARDVLIADSRNDDNFVLSQLTALFHVFHNMVVDMAEKEWPEGIKNKNTSLPSEDIGVYARGVTAYIFRNILREDLLERLLDPTVYEAYRYAHVKFLDTKSEYGSVPIEFAHAVGRIGHQMVRPNYVLNRTGTDPSLFDILDATSTGKGENVPPRPKWFIDWSLFFELDGKGSVPANFNWSAKIHPHILSKFFDSGLFPSLEQGRGGGLLYRDFIRGAALHVWSVPCLIQKIIKRLRRDKRGKLLDRVKTLQNRQRDIVEKALKRLGVKVNDEPATGSELTPMQYETIVNDPPLLLFVLAEAQEDTANGAHLGILGSIVFAEVFFGAMDRRGGYAPESVVTWEAEIEAATRKLFGGKKNIPNSMPDLIARVRKQSPDVVWAPAK